MKKQSRFTKITQQEIVEKKVEKDEHDQDRKRLEKWKIGRRNFP